MTSATFPLSVEIGAVLSSSLGAALRSAEGQLGRLGAALARLEGKSAGIARLEALRAQAAEAGQAWRRAQQEVARFQADKTSGALTPKGVLAARQRVEALQAKLSDASLPESRRLRLMRQLEAAQARLAEREAQAEARHARQLERLIAQAGRAKEAFGQLKAAIAEEQAALEKAGIATGRLAAEKVKLGQALEAVKAKTQALAQAQAAQQANLEQRSAYRAQLMDAAALGASLYGLIKPAVAFESVMADVRKVVDFETPAQFAQMSKDILQLSTRIPMAAEGIGQIVAAAGQAGIAREELVRFAEDAAKMGVAFDLTGEQAGAAMTGLRSIFALAQDEVVRLGDAFNHLSNNMDATAAGLLNVANRSGSTAKLFGLTGAQLGALGATFLALKTPPEVAATGINALLLKLATADKQGSKFQEALEGIGLSAGVMKEMIRRDAQGALITFLEHVARAPDVMGALSDLFGAEYADDIAKLVGSLDLYRQALGLVADEAAYAGSMQREYEARAATTANNLQLLKNQISRLGITIGNALLPPLNSLLGALMAPIGALAQLAERFPVITQVVVGTIGAVVGLKVATIALGYAWTFVKGPILDAQVAVQSARAKLARLQAQAAATGASAGILSLAWARIKMGALGLIAPIKSAALAFWSMLPAIGATTAALLANPITWIVAGIGAAVAGLALAIRRYWQPLAAWIGGFWQGIQEGIAPAAQGIAQALAPLEPLGRGIAWVFGSVAEAFSGAWRFIGELISPVRATSQELQALSASGHSVGQAIGKTLGWALEAITAPLRAVCALMELLGAGMAKVAQGIDWLKTKAAGLASLQPAAALSWLKDQAQAGVGRLMGGRAGAPAQPAQAMRAGMPAAQPVARASSVQATYSAPITIHAPAGADAREMARLVDERVRSALKDQSRRLGALYD
ncbi:TP901 family phage tail tape measure protein [Tepidimonas ignava]|uniref:Phage tail tape measure protein n=1 Tax=Tepidimonas ignava TaxID=114249 RepID=A0A4R3LJP1_9BURK|nr:phage tail tape measure protein [Tepidimonas ignava]TCS98744.1 TP901 family phage tail tape measure protein [Tepidimonas ignava]TSE20330.1 phage tail tape measure protein [Tepidimonas ignava]